MKLKLLSILLIALFAWSCNQTGDNADENTTDSLTTEAAAVTAEELIAFQSELRMGTFIKQIDPAGTEVKVFFVENYADFTTANPIGGLTEEQYFDNYEKNANYEKALVEIPVELMRKFNGIEKVTVKMPLRDKVYTISVTRAEIETFTKMKFADFFEDWSKFSDPFILDDAGRKSFIDKFVKIQ
jgi:hypothetical protein